MFASFKYYCYAGLFCGRKHRNAVLLAPYTDDDSVVFFYQYMKEFQYLKKNKNKTSTAVMSKNTNSEGNRNNMDIVLI